MGDATTDSLISTECLQVTDPVLNLRHYLVLLQPEMPLDHLKNHNNSCIQTHCAQQTNHKSLVLRHKFCTYSKPKQHTEQLISLTDISKCQNSSTHVDYMSVMQKYVEEWVKANNLLLAIKLQPSIFQFQPDLPWTVNVGQSTTTLKPLTPTVAIWVQL